MIKKLQSLVQSESRPTVSSGIRQPPLTDCIEVLLELGKSLVKDETVPSPETRRKRQAIYIMDNNQNRSLEQEHPLRQMQDSAVSLNLRSPTRSRRNRSRSRRTEVRTSQPSTPMPTNAQDIRPVLLSVSFAAQNTAELVQNGVVTSRTTDVTSSSSGSYRSNEYIIEPSPQAPLHNESEFINVRPLQGHIPFPQPNSTPSLKGYIRTPSGCELIEARVNRQTMSSVISQAYAEKCGLEVNQLEDDVDMWIYFSPRRAKKCKATVTIRWSPEQIGQRLFPVQCFVCKDYPMDIVFGKSFLDKREDYRRMWSAEDEV